MTQDQDRIQETLRRIDRLDSSNRGYRKQPCLRCEKSAYCAENEVACWDFHNWVHQEGGPKRKFGKDPSKEIFAKTMKGSEATKSRTKQNQKEKLRADWVSG